MSVSTKFALVFAGLTGARCAHAATVTAIPADIGAELYYRQGAMLVAYLQHADPAAFQRRMAAVMRKECFDDAVAGAYGVPMSALWTRFLAHTRSQQRRGTGAATGPLCDIQREGMR